MRHCFELDGTDYLLWLSRAANDYRLLVYDESIPVALSGGILRMGGHDMPIHIACDRDRFFIHLAGATYEITFKDPVLRHRDASGSGSEDILRAPMPGSVVSVPAEAGQAVTQGDTLLVIESMKLETAIRAPRDGMIETIHVALSQSFERDAPLVTMASLVTPSSGDRA